MVVDLHVHVGKDGLDVDAAARQAAAIGLDGLAVVGENEIARVGSRELHGVVICAGAEVTTDRGHYLVFLPRPEELPPIAEIFATRGDEPWPVRDVLARTRALGGAVVAAHPYDRNVTHPGGDVLFTLRGLTAVEAVTPRRGAPMGPAVEAADTLGLPCVGGSDARRSVEDVGRCATLFTRRFRDEAGLVDALRSGQCWPVDFGRPSGELAKKAGTPRPPRPATGEGPPRRRRRPRRPRPPQGG